MIDFSGAPILEVNVPEPELGLGLYLSREIITIDAGGPAVLK